MKTIKAIMRLRVVFEVPEDATSEDICDILNELDYNVSSDKVELDESETELYAYLFWCQGLNNS